MEQSFRKITDPGPDHAMPVRTGANYKCSMPECTASTISKIMMRRPTRFFRITRTSDGYARIACDTHKEAVTAAQAAVNIQEVI